MLNLFSKITKPPPVTLEVRSRHLVVAASNSALPTAASVNETVDGSLVRGMLQKQADDSLSP